MKFFTLLFGLLGISFSLFAQQAKDEVVVVWAENQDGVISINWKHHDGFTGTYSVLKRNTGETIWNEVATVNAPEATYTDKSLLIGEAYEFAVLKNSSPYKAYGYVLAGFNYAPSPIHGNAILLIDSLFIDSLGAEFERFESDLNLEGWGTKVIYAGRNELVPDVKDRIKNTVDEYTEMLIIIGHVPVPYSGNFTKFGTVPPDGHIEGAGNHTGAWAADAYYGDLDGTWTDANANHTDAKLDRGDNVPGDGKFDQSKIPSAVELQVGRIDFWGMTDFNKSEYELMRNYFERNHAYRTGEWKANEQALIDNNFKSFNLASAGYHNFSTFFDSEAISDVDDYIISQREENYLWSYGCGGGSFTSCAGLNNDKTARTSDIAADTLKNVFTIIAGSYFGDWDVTNNFLRAPLCNQSLISFWGGLPRWYVHHMAKGYNIGYGAKLTMNNVDDYYNGNFNSSFNSIHIALMGDPTLTLKGLPRPSNLSAVSVSGTVELTWTGAEGTFDGYNIYRWNQEGYPELINSQVITGTSYTDKNNWLSGNYTYTVRAVKLDENPSGSYYVTSGGPTANVSHVNSIDNPIEAQLQVFPSPANNTIHIKAEYASQMQIEIYNADGKFMMDDQINGAANLDISKFESGVYFIKCFSVNGLVGHGRFIKM